MEIGPFHVQRLQRSRGELKVGCLDEHMHGQGAELKVHIPFRIDLDNVCYAIFIR